MRIVLKLEMTITIDVEDGMERQNDPVDYHAVAECEHCGWRRIYSSSSSAKKAHAAHMRWCKKSSSSVKQAFEQVVAK